MEIKEKKRRADLAFLTTVSNYGLLPRFLTVEKVPEQAAFANPTENQDN